MAESRSDPKPPKGEADPPNLGNDNADSERIEKNIFQLILPTVQNVSALSVEIMIFFITQILREINFGDCRRAKSAIQTHLEAQNCDFHEFLHFLKVKV